MKEPDDKMTDQSKTNAALLEEVSILTHRIQELEQAEPERKRVEETFRLITDSMSDMIRVTDLQSVNLYTSPSHFNVLGYKPEERFGKSGFEIIHPEDVEHVIQVFSEGLINNKPGKVEYRIKHAEGHYIWLETMGDAIRNDQGEVTAVIQSSRDISDRKAAEEKLRKSEEKFRLITENMLDSVALVDANGTYQYITPSYREVLGYDPEDMIGNTGYSITHPDDLERIMRLYSEGIKKGLRETSYETRLRHKDGHYVPVEIRVRALEDPQGKIMGGVLAARDITQRQQLEKERKQTEDNLKETLEILRKAFGTTVQVLVSAVETRDPYTAGHQMRSADLARAMAKELGLSQGRIDGIRMAGTIHDIGKLSIPAEILSKPTKLSELEFALIKEHAKKGFEMLKDVESPWPLAEIVYQHHERMDGSGYPRGLKGEEIIMEARILAVADVVESMASHRPYRPALGLDAALAEIEINKGTLYDAEAVDACLRLFREKGFHLEGI